MRRRAWLRLGEGLVVLVILGASLWIFARSAAEPRFNPNEAMYLKRGRYFGHLFLERSVSGWMWTDQFATHTQTMLINYLVGGWMWARGYDPYRLPGFEFEMGQSIEQNRSLGRVPDAAVMAEIRTPMVVLSVGTVLLLYALGRLLGGPLAGIAAAGFTLGSPLAVPSLASAVSHGPLMFFVPLALLVGVLGARRGPPGALAAGWAIALGVALGLGFQTKLTAVFSLLAVAGWGALMAVLAVRRAGRAVRLGAAWAVGRGWLLALLVGYGVFVATNPHLYPDPLTHTVHLFRERAESMQWQATEFQSIGVPDPAQRPLLVFGHSLVTDTASGSRGAPLEAILAALGAAILGWRCWQGWRRSGTIPPTEGLVLITVLAYFLGISATLLVAYNAYFLPTLLLGTLLSGLGLSVAARAAPSLLLTLDRRRRPRTNDAELGRAG